MAAIFFVALFLARIYAKKKEALRCPIPCPIWKPEEQNCLGNSPTWAISEGARLPLRPASAANPSCHCAKRDDLGHGPNYRLTLKVKGKTVTETFDSPAALRKAQLDVVAFSRISTDLPATDLR